MMVKIRRVFLKVISITSRPVKENLCFFCFIYLLGIVTVFVEVKTLHFKIPRFNFFSLIFDVYLLCQFLMIIPKRFRSFFRIIISSIAYILAIINAFCVEHFYARIGPEILNVVLETNARESSEFVDKFINVDLLWSGVGVILFLIAIHLFFQYVKFKEVSMSPNFSILFQLCFSSLLFVSVFLCTHSRLKVVRLMFVSTVEDADVLISNYSLNTPFNNMLFSVKMREIANNGLKILAETQDTVKVDSCSYRSDNIVLIIGESYIKGHSQLYGYDKKTAPFQVNRKKQSGNGRLVSFEDVISPSNLTSVVFKNVFSLHSLDEKSDWAYSPLFPVLFRRAGYQVFFLTNQYVQALNTDIFNLSGGLFLNHSKLSTLQFDHRNTITHRYDMGLLEDYDSLMQYHGDHNLIIFHLAGQHIDFCKRSPDEYKVFQVSDYRNRKDLNVAEKQLVADYDNATYYNDMVVESIIRRFENQNVIIIYMPDHGEECYDETHRMGRLPIGNHAPETLRQEYCIPFWIWCSNGYIESHRTIFAQIEDSHNRRFMTDDLPHLLMYLAGISCKYYNEKRNLISPLYDVNRKRMINGKYDYDQIVRLSKSNHVTSTE